MKYDPHYIQSVLALFDRRAIEKIAARLALEQKLPPPVIPNPLESAEVRGEFKAQFNAAIDNGSLLQLRCPKRGYVVSQKFHSILATLIEKHAPKTQNLPLKYLHHSFEFSEPENIEFATSLLDYRNKLETALLFDSGRETIEKIFADAKI